MLQRLAAVPLSAVGTSIWPIALNTCRPRARKVSPVPTSRPPSSSCGVFELDRRARCRRRRCSRTGRAQCLILHAVGLGELLLVPGGAHVARARGDRPGSRPRRRAAWSAPRCRWRCCRRRSRRRRGRPAASPCPAPGAASRCSRPRRRTPSSSSPAQAQRVHAAEADGRGTRRRSRARSSASVTSRPSA